MSEGHTQIRQDARVWWRQLGVFRYSLRGMGLVWGTRRSLTVGLVFTSIAAGLLPAAIAYVGKLIVDAVVAAADQGIAADRTLALNYVAWEAGLVLALAAVQRTTTVLRSLLRAQLGQRVNVLILEKALTLSLSQFEDAEFYDKMSRARREASSRPLSLVMRTFGLAQNGISLASYGALLLQFSPAAVAILGLAALPAFIAETRFSNEAFRLFRWRTPETRKQLYLEAVLAREDYTKEVRLYGIGPRLLQRYRKIFEGLYGDDKRLAVRRGVWGYLLGVLSTSAFYGTYGWIAYETISGTLTLGEMTMYVLVFKQGQAAFAAALSAVGGMYEDNLYLSNLYEFLEEAPELESGDAQQGPEPGAGLRFEGVTFVYPGQHEPALRDITFALRPGEKLALVGENGAGKTTLIKLLTRMYQPTKGRILLDGLDLQHWDAWVLRQRVGVIFQDFARYQFTVGENIGVGDVRDFDNEERWAEAADLGMAAPFIEGLPARYHTQLGRWFNEGRELSLGQWQKIALSRAFMRRDADIMVLDEPTASMDSKAEAQVFRHFRDVTKAQMAIVISHRFSTVRVADRILVLGGGRIVEEGTHAALLAQNGVYAQLFRIQAAGYA